MVTIKDAQGPRAQLTGLDFLEQQLAMRNYGTFPVNESIWTRDPFRLVCPTSREVILSTGTTHLPSNNSQERDADA